MKLDEYDNLMLETLDSVLRVTLNRPDRRNALSSELLAELLAVLTAAQCDREISVLILRGAGKSFCSGYDVSPSQSPSDGEVVHISALERAQIIVQENKIFDLLWRSPLPSIAQIHGHCLAGGTDLALSCDLVVCATDALIGYPAVRSMGTPATHMWLYHLGPQWTKRLLLTGDSITGATAAQLGLALEAVEPGALEQHVLDLAARISWVTRELLSANKYVVNRGLDLMGRTLLQETAAMHDVLGRQAPGADTFARTAMSKGVKQAIAERDAPFAGGDPIR